MMRDTDYAYAVARIRSNETKLLSAQDIDGLLASESSAVCAARLADKGWESSDAAVDDGAMTARETERTWSLINEIAPDMDQFDFLRIPNDFHNLKAALKARLEQSEWRHLYMSPARADWDTVDKAVREKRFDLLPENMAEPAHDAYEALVAWVDGQMCEMIIDKASLEASVESAGEQGGLALRLAELNAFAADIRVAVRCARMKKTVETVRLALADCGALDAGELAHAAVRGEEDVREYLAECDKEAAEALSKGLRAFDRLCGSRRQALIDSHKYDILGIAPLICYIIRREDEIRKARIIMAGLRNGVDRELIRAML